MRLGIRSGVCLCSAKIPGGGVIGQTIADEAKELYVAGQKYRVDKFNKGKAFWQPRMRIKSNGVLQRKSHAFAFPKDHPWYKPFK